MTTYYALIGCGSSKQDSAAPAGELYTSGYAEKKRRFDERFCEDSWILSAKHHLISSDTVIEPYEKHIDSVDIREWGRQVRTALKEEVSGLDVDAEFVVLAPEDYTDAIRGTFHELPQTFHTPFDDSGGIGYQQEWLKKQNRRSEPDFSIPCGPDSDPTEATTLSEYV